MNLYSIILAGGKGRRLWPVSRRSLPKQFIDFFGVGRTLLQQTFDRMVKIMPKENILVVTNNHYKDIAREQLPELSEDNFVLEPVNRNTAPSTLLALRKIQDEDSAVVITPSDQTILDEDRFADAVHSGADFAHNHNCVITMGVNPTRPEPGYGYIQTGDPLDNEHDIYTVKSFTEKPDRDFARMFIESGEFLWNSGIYMSRPVYMAEKLTKLLDADSAADYSQAPNVSIDMVILERMPCRTVMKCVFGWADIGAWHGIYEAMSTDEHDNVVVNSKSHLVADNATHNVISLPEGKLAVISGLDGYIIAEKDNVLLICQKEDSSAIVRKLLGKIENEEGLEEFY